MNKHIQDSYWLSQVSLVSSSSSIFINPFYQRWHHYCATFNHFISTPSCQLELSYTSKYRQNKTTSFLRVTRLLRLPFLCSLLSVIRLHHHRQDSGAPVSVCVFDDMIVWWCVNNIHQGHSFAPLAYVGPVGPVVISFLRVIFRFFLWCPPVPSCPITLWILAQTLIHMWFPPVVVRRDGLIIPLRPPFRPA